MQSRYSPFYIATALLVLTGLAILSLADIRPPRPLAVDAPGQAFSAMRARAHIEQIACSPHPLDSAAEHDVRQYIVNAITQMGITPQVEHRSVLVHPSNGDYIAGEISNIVAVLPGAANGKALLLMAHYDSVASSFGASDDGNAVAVLLETLRALRSGPRLRNDIIFLFTDGEESGNLGAHAFLQDHTLGYKIGLVLNFEARGTSGAAFLFETSPNDGGLIREFSKDVPYPAASSLFYEIYRRLPNDTDLTAFKRAGFAGMNFAYLDNQLFYHTAADNVAHLDSGSLQHQGSYALSLARGFGSLDLEHIERPNSIYFSVLGSYLLCYPEHWAVPAAVLLLLVGAGLAFIGLRQRALSLRGLLTSLLKFPLACASCGVLAAGLWWVVRLIQPQYRSFLPVQTDVYNHTWYILAIAALSIVVSTAMFTRRDKVGAWERLLAVVLWLCFANLFLAIVAPGASYLLTLPVIFAEILLSAACAKPQWRRHGSPGAPPPSVWLVFLILICSTPAVLLLVPLLRYLVLGFGMQMTGVVAVIVVVILGLAAPLVSGIPARPFITCISIIGAGLLLMGSFTAGFSPTHPRQNTIFYALDADSGKAVWANRQSQQDSWTAGYLGAHPLKTLLPYVSPSHRMAFYTHAAPAPPLTPPEAAILDDKSIGNTRHIRLLVRSPRDASTVLLYTPHATPLYSLQVGPQQPAVRTVSTVVAGHFETLIIRGLPPQGMAVTLDIPAGAPFHFRLVDKTDGLPVLAGMAVNKRPPSMIRSREFDFFNESTLISKNYAF